MILLCCECFVVFVSAENKSIGLEKTLPSHLSVWEVESLPIDGCNGGSGEKVIQPILMVMTFVFVSQSPEKCWCGNLSQLQSSLSNLTVKSLHEKLVLEGDKCLGFLLEDIIHIELPQDEVIADVGVGVNRVCVGFRELPKEILEWEEWLVEEAIGAHSN